MATLTAIAMLLAAATIVAAATTLQLQPCGN